MKMAELNIICQFLNTSAIHFKCTQQLQCYHVIIKMLLSDNRLKENAYNYALCQILKGFTLPICFCCSVNSRTHGTAIDKSIYMLGWEGRCSGGSRNILSWSIKIFCHPMEFPRVLSCTS